MPKSQGFGCMGMSAFYSSALKGADDESNIAVLIEAMNMGVELFNTATFYGPLNEEGFGANLRLLRKFVERVDRSKIKLMVKVAMDTRCPVEKTGTVWVNRGNSEGIQNDVNYALETLGVDYIDIVVLCRVPFDIPLEDTMAGLKAVVESGKARAIGLSEASAGVISRAHAIFPIQYVEQEWSLFARDIEEEIVPVCRERGIKIVAYCPLGRGALTEELKNLQTAALDPHDYRLTAPKFQPENFEHNARIVDLIQEVATRKQISVGQLALAWLHAQGDDVIPIPGTTKINHLRDNVSALTVALSEEELAEINSILESNPVKGDRYAHMAMTFHGNK